MSSLCAASTAAIDATDAGRSIGPNELNGLDADIVVFVAWSEAK
jgi:hypothetical protein